MHRVEKGHTRLSFLKSQIKTSTRFTLVLFALGVRLGLAEAVNAGITTVHNRAHNIRQPAFADADIRQLSSSLQMVQSATPVIPLSPTQE
ncbi:hypothetical protein [Sodalis sp. dw_96]|uniref:hypothetical protein n=1 Tax=Sodalis sp. dw_96 TaxID=2719794 RepID=UPI001BD6B5AE|nr:hypothetical protein [Sodalis sp. dw_96]